MYFKAKSPSVAFVAIPAALGLGSLAIVSLGVSLGAGCSRVSLDRTEKGRYVASVVREQLQQLAQATVSIQTLKSIKNWPDDFLLLNAWLIEEFARGERARVVQTKLTDISQGKAISPVLRKSLERWNDALVQWTISHSSTSMELMTEARERYFEALGLQKIGRTYDATVLFVWVSMNLNALIRREPNNTNVPEALYLLGDSLLRIRHSMPRRLRGDRMLQLCVELFPETIWAKISETRWRQETGHAIH